MERQFPGHEQDFTFSDVIEKMPKAVTSDQVTLMMQETCVAEWIHGLDTKLQYGRGA